MTGLISADFPFFSKMVGFLCKFNTLEPYPTPASYIYASTISPVTIGVNVNVLVNVEPRETFTITSISGYLKI